MFVFDQFVAHLVGDYLLQSHTEAVEKTSSNWYAFTHVLKYTLPFLFITQSWISLSIIFGTHFLIDRYRLARYWNYVKNGMFQKAKQYDKVIRDDEGEAVDVVFQGNYAHLLKPLTVTGYPKDVPAWLSDWLLIITDNILHILINGLAIYYFG